MRWETWIISTSASHMQEIFNASTSYWRTDRSTTIVWPKKKTDKQTLQCDCTHYVVIAVLRLAYWEQHETGKGEHFTLLRSDDGENNNDEDDLQTLNERKERKKELKRKKKIYEKTADEWMPTIITTTTMMTTKAAVTTTASMANHFEIDWTYRICVKTDLLAFTWLIASFPLPTTVIRAARLLTSFRRFVFLLRLILFVSSVVFRFQRSAQNKKKKKRRKKMERRRNRKWCCRVHECCVQLTYVRMYKRFNSSSEMHS